MNGVVPAAFAFLAFGFLDLYFEGFGAVGRRGKPCLYRGDDEQVAQFGFMPLKKGAQRIGGGDQDLRFEARADEFVVARLFESLQNVVADAS